MAQSKHEFFEKGVVNQKRPSIVIDIKIPDLSKIKNWNAEQKQQAKQFINKAKKRVEELCSDVESCC